MKKTLSMILAAMLLASLSTTAFAETNNGGTTSITVNGSYQAGEAPGTVISADITWGAMEFTYKTGTQGTWKPENHQYENGTDAGWTASGNSITVTNHSNADIKASFAFAKSSTAPSDMIGSFESTDPDWDMNENSFIVSSAVDTEVEFAPSGSATFTIEGGAIEADIELGTISVTIAKSNTSQQG